MHCSEVGGYSVLYDNKLSKLDFCHPMFSRDGFIPIEEAFPGGPLRGPCVAV